MSTLLRSQGALQGHCAKWALHFMHFPGLSFSGSRVLCKGTGPDGLCDLCPSQVQAAQVAGCMASAPSQVDHASYASPWPLFPGCTMRAQPQVCHCLLWGAHQAVTLLADMKHPWSQIDVVNNWQPAQFGGRCGLWAEIAVAPCLLALVVAHLPLCF